jgi:AAA+ superfamily predicted ATPase
MKMDMKRNALVSVFLRVLEYYGGILILTTNRIGTFDEAFKSRVQLALHYPALSEENRSEIWGNFLDTLSDAEEGGNIEEIKKKLEALSRPSLNGRQIRNTVNTARQLARYKKESLRYYHVDQSLRVVKKFEQHVLKVHGHEREEYQREMGNR